MMSSPVERGPAWERPAEPAIHPETRIGHAYLKVADLDRALGFYQRVLGF